MSLRVFRQYPRCQVLLLCSLVLAACTRDDISMAPRTTNVRTAFNHPEWTAANPKVQRREAALRPVALGLARALHSSELRTELVRQLRESRYTTEHKLSLNALLSDATGPWSSAIAAKANLTPAAMRDAVDGAGSFEVYMPVAQHRDAYDGGTDLLVAAGIAEGLDVPAFTLDGRSVVLSHTTVPTAPVLVITPSETDFETPLQGAEFVNRAARGGAIGTWKSSGARGAPPVSLNVDPIDPCQVDPAPPDCYQPPPPPPPPSTAGLYLRQTNIYDAYDLEEWWRGNPEMAIRISLPPFPDINGNPVPGARVACVQQKFTDADPRYWDQDDPQWTASGSRRGLFFTANQVDAATNTFRESLKAFPIEIFENDNGDDCDFETDNASDREQTIRIARGLANLYQVGSAAIGCYTNAQNITVLNIGPSALKQSAPLLCPFFKVGQAAWGLLKEASGDDDDLIGMIYPVGPPPNGSSTPTEIAWWNKMNYPQYRDQWANYVIIKGNGAAADGDVRGFVRIEYLEAYPY